MEILATTVKDLVYDVAEGIKCGNEIDNVFAELEQEIHNKSGLCLYIDDNMKIHEEGGLTLTLQATKFAQEFDMPINSVRDLFIAESLAIVDRLRALIKTPIDAQKLLALKGGLILDKVVFY